MPRVTAIFPLLILAQQAQIPRDKKLLRNEFLGTLRL